MPMPMPIPTPDRRDPGKRADRAYDTIKHKLVTGALAGGTRLDITQLGDELQTSRQPVLAAIGRLAAEGFLRVVPQVGCWVASVGFDEVADFFRVFALTEGLACELGAARRQPAQLDALHANLDATDRLLASKADADRQSREFFRLNRAFHGLIHEMAHSSYVAAQAGSMWDRCDFYLASADPHIQGERIAESAVEHAAIALAIDKGQVKRAGTLMVAHIQSFGDAAVRRLTADGDRQGGPTG
jgi:DNA-binding GntR family transcriptional regulator